MSNILVVYYSHSGNTRLIADQIAAKTGAKTFELQPFDEYPRDYQKVVDQARKEISAGYKPMLKEFFAEIASFDIVFVGSPCWCGTIAPPIATFLTGHDFSGKTIVPFMTHEGSGMGRTEADIKKMCPNATVLKGLPIRGSAVKSAESSLQNWLDSINFSI